MRDLGERYETDRNYDQIERELGDYPVRYAIVERAEGVDNKLPPLPPVSHMELGRQEPFCFPDRRRDPFEGVTNNVLVFDQPPVTIESVIQLMDELDPLPSPFPWLDDDHVLVLKPPTPGISELGITIYWTDSQGRTRGPDGRVL